MIKEVNYLGNSFKAIVVENNKDFRHGTEVNVKKLIYNFDLNNHIAYGNAYCTYKDKEAWVSFNDLKFLGSDFR